MSGSLRSVAAIACFLPLGLRAEGVQFVSPVPMQVFQREGLVPREAHPHAVGGPAQGFADVPLIIKMAGETSAVAAEQVEALVRVLRISDATPLTDQHVTLRKSEGGTWEGSVRLPAGGWYKLELEFIEREPAVSGSMEPVGVGEVFLIAGQSYATNTSDEWMTFANPTERVVA